MSVGMFWVVGGPFRGGVVMGRDPDPCSCRLARSMLRENRLLISMPGVLLRVCVWGVVIGGHLEGGKWERVMGSRAVKTKTPSNLNVFLPSGELEVIETPLGFCSSISVRSDPGIKRSTGNLCQKQGYTSTTHLHEMLLSRHFFVILSL